MTDRRAEKVMKKGALTAFQLHSQNTFLNHRFKMGYSEISDHLSIVTALKNPLRDLHKALRNPFMAKCAFILCLGARAGFRN